MSTAHIFYPAPRAYYEWLGRFVEAFASVEASLFQSLEYYVGLPEGFAQALFSGARGEQTVSFINRICEIRPLGKEIMAELSDVFGQFKAVNGIRNSIVHHGTVADQFFKRTDQRRSTNRIRAHASRSLSEYKVTTNILRCLTDDCAKISEHLFSLQSYPEFSLEMRSQISPILGAAWQYKRDEP